GHRVVTLDQHIVGALIAVGKAHKGRVLHTALFHAQVVPTDRLVVATGQKGVRVVRHGGDVVHTLVLALEQILVGGVGPIQIGVDDAAVAGARDDLRTGSISGPKPVSPQPGTVT